MDERYIQQTFQYLHSIPEVALEEYKTAAFVAGECRKFGYQVLENVGGTTGVVAILDSGREGRCIALRSDMDALPYVVDGETVAVHACGHDAHMTMLLATAKEIATHKIASGRLKLVFQPAEEILKGAIAIAKSGVLDDVEELYGMHIIREVPSGKAACGVLHGAGCMGEVVVRGKAAHGARPQQGVNALEAAVSMIVSLNAMRVDPRVSHSFKVTRFHAGGEAINLIPDRAVFNFDMRSQTNAVMQEMKEKVRLIAEGTAAAFGAQVEVSTPDGVLAAEYDPELMALAETIIRQELGDGNALPPVSIPAGEDFHFYKKFLPWIKTVFFGLGVDVEPALHNINMSFDHSKMVNGVKLFTAVIDNRLGLKNEKEIA